MTADLHNPLHQSSTFFQNTRKLKSQLAGLPNPVPVVLDAWWVNGLGVIHGLAAAGLRSLAISPRSSGIGLHSRFTVGLVCPDPAVEEDAFIDFMAELGRLLPGKGVLLVTDDTCMLALARGRDRLEPYYIYSFPELEPLLHMMDKWEQYRHAEEDCQVPIPRTLQLDSAADLDRWPDDAYPAILKGRLGKAFSRSSGRQVIEVQNRAGLAGAYQKYAGNSLILQEIIPGGDDLLYTLGSYISPSGEVLGAFTGRKLVQKPERYGTCREGESLACKEVLEQGLALLKCFGFYGVSQVEFKLDPRDGKYKLIEINGRFWMWHSLATYCGVNLSAIAYRDLSGQQAGRLPSQSYGQRWIMGLLELMVHPRYLKIAPRQWSHYLSVRRMPHVDAVSTWRDPLPSLMFFYNMVFNHG